MPEKEAIEYGVLATQPGEEITSSDFLGRDIRAGSWEELSYGTFRVAREAAIKGDWEVAEDLIRVSLLEAEELREVYELWPKRIITWLNTEGVPKEEIDHAVSELEVLIGSRAAKGIEAAWSEYEDAAESAVEAFRERSPEGLNKIEETRLVWLRIHDEAVDRVSGLVSIAVEKRGEQHLGALWNYLMADWYDIHEERYDLANQSWERSAHQLLVSIVDGFHAHLSGSQRQGDMEIVREQDRIGFRFQPCGSGGRAVDAEITDGKPRSGPPFNFAVTTEKHDWAWNKVGICSYCVHCCLLNEVVPIDRLGYPTRVIDPPVWTGEPSANTTCTWWVYNHPSLVPDSIYERVGRSPERRPKRDE